MSGRPRGEAHSGTMEGPAELLSPRRLAYGMKISMYLSSSKYWWAYLGIQSNPSILSRSDPGGRAIFFDNLDILPPIDVASDRRTKYFYILWDGLSDRREIDKAKLLLGPASDLTVLVVGPFSEASCKGCSIQALYPEGPLCFGASSLPLDLRTRIILWSAKMKTLLMPLKNLLESKRTAFPVTKLLCAKRKIVFCGSYGTIPRVVEELCDRHDVEPRVFDGYEFYLNEPNPSLEKYGAYLRSNSLFLACLYDRSEINATFFLSAVSLLGREYFIEKMRSEGHDLFLNRYGSGINLNVYTTPFYSQHLFIDFGSVVGKGNYPRIADLRYFKKKTVAFDLTGEIDELLALARSGTLERHFEREWELKSPEIQRSMEMC